MLNTDGLDGRTAYDLWRAATFDRNGDVLVVSGDTSNFYARQAMHVLPRAWILDSQMSALTYERRAETARKDQLDTVCFEWARGAGGNRTETRQGESIGGPGSVTVVDQARPYLRRVAEADFIIVQLDRSLLDEHDVARMHGAHLSGARGRMIGDFFSNLSASPNIGRTTELETTMAAVVSATVAGSADRAHEAAAALGPLALLQARRYIDGNLWREGVAVEEVVAATGVSRATLYRLFEPYGGLARFMWSRRLERAREMINDPAERRPIVEISEACGFTDPGHFARAFRREFGLRPRDLRAYHAERTPLRRSA